MTKLLFASQNQGKLEEIRTILSSLPFEIISPSQLGEINRNWRKLVDVDVEETGSSLKENAFIKAQFFAEETQLLTVADDSGLLVNALNGFPGVDSNRWLDGTDNDRYLALLEKLSDVKDRQASFATTLCLIDPKKDLVEYFEGSVQGEIADQPEGEEGFGYDPIFIPEGFDESFAQLGVEIKNKLSHRKMALVKLSQFLEKQYR